jgi:hypothetical protein
MQTSILLSVVEARGRGGEGTCRLNQEYELKAVWHTSILFYPSKQREMEEALKIGVICASQFRGCNRKVLKRAIINLKVGTNENGSACGRWLSIGI